MEELLAFLERISPISDGLKDHLYKILKRREVARKEYLLKAGHICRNISFIQKGLIRCFYIKDDIEICSWFMKEGDVIISVESFFKQKPSYESIQAIEDSVIWSTTYEEVQNTYRQFIEFNIIGRVLTERYYTLSEQRLRALRMQSGMERYHYVLENHPELIQRVPSKYLATYLGMTDVWLSKIRGV